MVFDYAIHIDFKPLKHNMLRAIFLAFFYLLFDIRYRSLYYLVYMRILFFVNRNGVLFEGDYVTCIAKRFSVLL